MGLYLDIDEIDWYNFDEEWTTTEDVQRKECRVECKKFDMAFYKLRVGGYMIPHQCYCLDDGKPRKIF